MLKIEIFRWKVFPEKEQSSQATPFGEVAHRDKARLAAWLDRLFGAELRGNLQEMSVETEHPENCTDTQASNQQKE